MKNKLTYLYFRKNLKDTYSEKELRQLFGSIKKMDEESRGWVAAWMNGEGYPKDEIENVDIFFLIDECNFQPLNAIIILDWLKNEPEAAKFCLQRYLSSGKSDENIKLNDSEASDDSDDEFDMENEFIEY